MNWLIFFKEHLTQHLNKTYYEWPNEHTRNKHKNAHFKTEASMTTDERPRFINDTLFKNT